MKVFIGWSGERSQALAQALREWIPLVLHFVDPWLSETDIAAGERWAQSVSKELESSNFGILSVTQDNVTSPWILFEAGSLAKSLEGSRVIPLLLDLEFSEISGPLAQFQAKKVDKEGVNEVIQSINHAEPQPVPEARATQLFEALWPQLESTLESIPKRKSVAKTTRPQHEILEELVSGVRSLDSRLTQLSEIFSSDPLSRRHRRLHRMHPMMFRELGEMLGEPPNDPIGLLFFAGMVRDEIPWLYELAIEAYRAAKTGPSAEAKATLHKLVRATKFLSHSPISEEFGVHPRTAEMLHMIIRDFDDQIALSFEEEPAEEANIRPKRKKEGK